MSKFGSLLKTQLNARYGFSLAKYNMKNDKKALRKGIGIGLAILFAVGEFAFFYTFLMIKLFQAAQSLNTPQLIITMGTAVSGLFILFFGIFYIIGALFLAKDTELLSSLPLKQGSVFLSKFIQVIIGEYPFALFLILPPVIIYGIGAGKGLIYYLVALISIALIPLIPLVISSVLSLGLMRIVSRSRRRDLITIIGSIILLIAVFLGQNYFFAGLSGKESGTNMLKDLLSKSDGIVALSGKIFPPSVWITRALSLTGFDAFLNLLYLILASAVAFGFVYLIASFIYIRGATAQLETEKKMTKTRLKYSRTSPVRVLFMVEWKNILRTPIYALNSLVSIFIGPLIMCMPLFGGNLANDPDIKALFSLIRNNSDSPALILIIAGIMTLFAMINPAVCSTFSREGKGFWMLKNIPVEPAGQATGKFAAGYSISFLCVITTSIVMEFALKVSVTALLTSVIISTVALIPICALGMLVDLKKPKLNWGNPQEAIKQNMNVIFGMLIGLTFIAAFGLFGFGLIQLTRNPLIINTIILLALIGASILSLSVLRKSADKAYQRVDA